MDEWFVHQQAMGRLSNQSKRTLGPAPMPPSHSHLAAARARAMPYSCSCISHPSSQGTWSTYPNNITSDYHRTLPEMSIVNVKPLEDPLSSHLTPDYHPSSSNPSTPYQQNEFNSTNEFGVPYHHVQPSSVNSLTDALCPNGESNDRQVTPTSPSLSSARVTGTRSRLTTEQNIDDLTAFLQDPNNLYLTDDLTSTLYEDIEALADTYLGGASGHDAAAANRVDNDIDYRIILNFLCSDDLISTVCHN